MKRLLAIILSIHFSLFTIHHLIAQQQLDNPGFEEWEDAGTVQEEPVKWSSIKTSDAGTIVNEAAPVVWGKSSDAHSGNYSVKLFATAAFSIVANGTMTNGQVHADFNPDQAYVFTNPEDIQWHTPFTDRPDSLVFWYKAFPQGNDFGKIRIILHIDEGSMPEFGTEDNIVGEAIYFFPQEQVSQWTKVSVPFVYFKPIDPEYILCVINSGDGTNAVEGSEAYFDDIQLIYNPESITENSLQGVSLSPGNKLIRLIMEKPSGINNLEIEIFDLSGRTVYQKQLLPAREITCPVGLQAGLYIYRLRADNEFLTGKVYLH
jgi:hypothetical protein